ncbi:TPA: winged helix-turn-helix domain-containing protein [Klebsiella aerogenes]|uniref:winged helix-turn-helix domain-containing protein n=1 Tax=Klebsiella aerogenes TaxID=548 RepID=UPI003309C108|nr:winged helix-turn-helix domain-containing protein [Klebsiella aerogenes]
MSEKILINDQVWFEPEGHVLRSVNDPEQSILLPVPAARCLMVLLSEHGEIITIRQLHERVWNENKAVVSDNTIYQNISVLRKSLVDAGVEQQIIETLTRRGWCIPESVSVSHINDTAMKEESDPVAIIPVPETPETLAVITMPEIKKIKLSVILSGLLLFVSVFAFIYSIWAQHTEIPTRSFAGYTKLGELGTCHIYRNASNIPDVLYHDILSRNQLSCRELPWWYITIYTKTGSSSVISCRNSLAKENHEPPECTSLYFRGIKKNDWKK